MIPSLRQNLTRRPSPQWCGLEAAQIWGRTSGTGAAVATRSGNGSGGFAAGVAPPRLRALRTYPLRTQRAEVINPALS